MNISYKKGQVVIQLKLKTFKPSAKENEYENISHL